MYEKAQNFVMVAAGAMEMQVRSEDVMRPNTILLLPPKLRVLEYLVVERVEAASIKSSGAGGQLHILIPESPSESDLFRDEVPVLLKADLG